LSALPDGPVAVRWRAAKSAGSPSVEEAQRRRIRRSLLCRSVYPVGGAGCSDMDKDRREKCGWASNIPQDGKKKGKEIVPRGSSGSPSRGANGRAHRCVLWGSGTGPKGGHPGLHVIILGYLSLLDKFGPSWMHRKREARSSLVRPRHADTPSKAKNAALVMLLLAVAEICGA
jgi:hypothetical protein